MGSNSRSFGRVFEMAQLTLKQTFGMEMVELQSKAALEKERTGVDEEQLEESRKATATKKKGLSFPALSIDIQNAFLTMSHSNDGWLKAVHSPIYPRLNCHRICFTDNRRDIGPRA